MADWRGPTRSQRIGGSIDSDAATAGLTVCAKACFAKNSGVLDITSGPLAFATVPKTANANHETVSPP